jgi:hypothetical protein
MYIESNFVVKVGRTLNQCLPIHFNVTSRLGTPAILRALCVLCGSYISTDVCFALNIRTWTFEATVVEHSDPLFDAAGVRLGDPVRGTFSYDLETVPDSGDDYAEYNAPPGFRGLQVAIENPRDETQIEYVPLVSDASDSWVEVWSYDDTEPPDVEDENGVHFYQFTELPNPDWPDSDFVAMWFNRPGVSTDFSLPTAYELDDWPYAVIFLWADLSPGSGITAEIHTIKPVTPGDFNLDGDVDGVDYTAWRSDYGMSGYSDADGNRDGSIDAADYVVWRDNLPTTSVANPAANVPEPTSFVHCLFALVCLLPRSLARFGAMQFHASHRPSPPTPAPLSNSLTCSPKPTTPAKLCADCQNVRG